MVVTMIDTGSSAPSPDQGLGALAGALLAGADRLEGIVGTRG